MFRFSKSKASSLSHWTPDECVRQVAQSVPVASHGLLINEHMAAITAAMTVCRKCFGPVVLGVDRYERFCCKCDDVSDARSETAEQFLHVQSLAWVNVGEAFEWKVVKPNGGYENCFNKEQTAIVGSAVNAWGHRLYTFAYAEALARIAGREHFPIPKAGTSYSGRVLKMRYIINTENRVNEIVSDRTRAGEGPIIEELQNTWYGTKFRPAPTTD